MVSCYGEQAILKSDKDFDQTQILFFIEMQISRCLISERPLKLPQPRPPLYQTIKNVIFETEQVNNMKNILRKTIKQHTC